MPAHVFAQNGDTLYLPFDNGNGEMSRQEHRKLMKRIKASDEFYRKLKNKADSGYIYKQLYPLIFRGPQIPVNQLEMNTLPANAIFRHFRNDYIRSIRVIRLKPFGNSIYDTIYVETGGLTKAINNLHFETHESVVRNYLQFKVGDRFNPVKVSDNERIIRSAPIFEDARFIIDPVGRDSVDVILVVKDIFPLGADLKINSVNNGSLRIYNKNIFGFGHQLSQSFVYDHNYSPSFYLGEGNYIIRNIRRTFTDFNVGWTNTPVYRRIGIDITRPFITPEIKYAGGLIVSFNQGWLYNDRSVDRYRYSNRLFDAWLGYAVITNRLKNISSRRQQVALTGRLYQLDFYDAPYFSVLNIAPFVNTTRLLFGFNIVRSEYYRTNMLYGYGRTEDIPYGHKIELIFGFENTELEKRPYSAIKLSFLKPTPLAGLLGLDLQIGGYLQDGFYKDGVLKTQLKIISPLVTSGRSSIRNFGFIGYTTGLLRNIPGSISINDGNTGNMFHKYDILGYQRLRGRIESVVFTPYYFLGFRFAPFFFAEAAVIAPVKEKFVNQSIYPALGLGIRLRNENLVFSAFQISFAWHPVAPNGIAPVELLFSDLPSIGLDQYLINKPEIVEYK
ncbi:MAG: hypothetical protein ACM3ME_06990 [Chloroflexota bacterium]